MLLGFNQANENEKQFQQQQKQTFSVFERLSTTFSGEL